MISQAGMGVGGLTWQEMKAWRKELKLKLSNWEKLTVKGMSDAYANEYSAASEKDRPAPYCSLPMDFNRDEMSKQVVNVMQSLMARQPVKKS